jgi:predicted DCC family thiol-disulfide oxidoreductase YuxK
VDLYQTGPDDLRACRQRYSPSPYGRPTMAPRDHPVVLFDGVCALCDGAVQFVIDRDAEGQFRFATLQSETGQRLAREHNVDTAQTDSLVVIDGGRAHVMSDAALRIAGGLPRPWSWARWLRVVPRPLRDAVYRTVARNRYQWFGRRSECRIPTPELRARFLDL